MNETGYSRAGKVVILHGTFGSPEENWFPWLARELRGRDVDVCVPSLPTPEGQSLDRWTDLFEIQVGDLHPEMCLVGHSLGVAFILNLIQQSAVGVRGAFLVSGFVGRIQIEEFDVLNASFVDGPFRWGEISSRVEHCVMYHGSDDPYVPVRKGREIEGHLGAELRLIESGGHLNAEAGFDSFPLLLADVCELLGLEP